MVDGESEAQRDVFSCLEISELKHGRGEITHLSTPTTLCVRDLKTLLALISWEVLKTIFPVINLRNCGGLSEHA